MPSPDQLVERAADWLDEQASRQRAAGDGWQAWLADELAEDAAFLRKLKPSLIRARATGRATPEPPAPARRPVPAPAPPPPASHASPAPRPWKAPPSGKRGASGDGPNPFLVAGAALVAGIVLAKLIDWRGHAHPRN